MPPLGLPPGAARFTKGRSWTRRWLVKAAGHVSLSPARKSAGESPSFRYFHLGPSTFNLFFGPDFCYISFDLVRLGPSIENNSM